MERVVANQGIKTINLYDIFANIVPGVYLLMGLYVGVHPTKLVELFYTQPVTVPVGLPLFLSIITVAFVVGQLLQLGGGVYDDDHGFNNLMNHIRGGDGPCRYEISEIEDGFWEMCLREFDLTDEFESHDTLFNLLLSYVESSGRSRALRLQALYLFVRGVFVASAVLLSLYGIASIGLFFEYWPDIVSDLLRPLAVNLSYVGATVILTLLTDRSRRGLERDWIEYTVTEAYLEMMDQEHHRRYYAK